MIDLTAPVELSVRGVRAWADLEDPGRVWACSDGPRWSVGADGRPDVRVMLYHRGTGPVEGGTVTANVDLALTGEERETVLREVGEQRAAQAERADDAGTPVPQALVPTACVPLECTAGDIELHLIPGLTAEAGVSLTGDNRATFMLTLDASTGPGLAAAWADGLPEALSPPLRPLPKPLLRPPPPTPWPRRPRRKRSKPSHSRSLERRPSPWGGRFSLPAIRR